MAGDTRGQQRSPRGRKDYALWEISEGHAGDEEGIAPRMPENLKRGPKCTVTDFEKSLHLLTLTSYANHNHAD